MEFLDSGYHPVLWFDGTNLDVYPDFMVSHLLSHKPESSQAHVIIPLLKPLKKAYTMIGRSLDAGVLAYPAPGIRIQKGKELVEYDIALMGTLGFELIKGSARTTGGENASERTGEKALQ